MFTEPTFPFWQKIANCSSDALNILQGMEKMLFKFTKNGGVVTDAMRKSKERLEKILLGNDVLLAAVYVDLTNDQLERGRKASVAIVLSMKELKKRNSRADEVDESQIFSKDETLTSVSGNEDFEKHHNQHAKRRKKKKGKTTDKSSPLQQFKTNFIRALNDRKKTDRTSKLIVKTAKSRNPDILQKMAHIVTALQAAPVTKERVFSLIRMIRSNFDEKGLTRDNSISSCKSPLIEITHKCHQIV